MSDWQTILAIDNDPAACAVYRANFPDVLVEWASVSDLIDRLPNADVIIGGPPCQPFSTAGEMEGEADERDRIPDFIAAVKKVKPRTFLMENVRGLIAEANWPYFARALNELEALDYDVQWKLLDAVSFGVPQFRERVWVWGIRKDLKLKHQWPLPTHAWPPPQPCMFGSELKPAIMVGRALELDGAIRRIRGSGVIRRDHPMDEPEPTIMQPTRGKSGLMLVGILDVQNDKMHSIDEPSGTIGCSGDGHHAAEIQYDHGLALENEPSPTIKAGGNFDANGHQGGGCPPAIRIIGGGRNHPADANGNYRRDKRDITDEPGVYIRRLSPLECARLQSMPDDFKWPEKITKTAMYRIIGNGWASKMGKVFADAFHRADPQSRTMIDLFCGGGLGAVGWHGRCWEFRG